MSYAKKLIAAAMTLAMALAICAVPALADGYSISVQDSDTHTYNVYQVLTGTLANEGDTNLGNPAWGADATEAAKATDVNAFIEELQGKSGKAVADLVASKVNTAGDGQGTVSKNNPITDLPAGYYVLVDKTTLTGDHEKDTLALHVVQVVNNIDGIQIKWDTTSDDKVITSDSLGTDNTDKNNNDIDPDAKTDNVSIGDTVNYQITAKVPANASSYNYFYFVVNDTLDAGLTFTQGSIKVYKNSVDAANLLAATTDYEVHYGQNEHTFEVGLVDAKSHAGENIIVTYSAVLNENAKIGEESNDNTSTVTYSTNPNHDYDGANNPAFPGQTDKDAVGETPVTETKTYTTGIEIQKVDDKGNVLTGAKFKIEGTSTETVLVSSEVFAEDADGTYYKLKGDKYTTQAPITADYMQEAAAGATEGYVEDASYTGEGKVEVGGKTYRPYAPATDQGKTVYTLVKANTDQYADNKTYSKTVTYEAKDTTKNVVAEAEVGPDGVVTFKGLGAGDYTITETQTPAGYNTIAPMNVNITFTAGGDPVWSTTTTSNFTYDESDGVFKTEVVNQSGSTLPETGGMGTTILYVAGAIMVLVAGVYLITKRRASKESDL